MPFNSPAFLSYNDSLDQAARSICGRLNIRSVADRFSPRVRSYSPAPGSALYETFLPIWENEGEWLAAREVLRMLAFDKFDRPGPREVKEAFLSVIVRGEDPEPDSVGERVAIMYGSREDRWRRLAHRLGISFPDSFPLWRGMTCARYDYVADVVAAWSSEDSDEFPLEHDVLSSWSLSRRTAEIFAEKDKNAAVIVRTDVDFFDTLADKWVDDGAYVVPWNLQSEVLVATSEPNSLTVYKGDTIVWYQGRRYTYTERTKLIAAWQASHR